VSEKWGRVSTFDNYCSSFFTWRGIRPFLPTLGTSQWSWHMNTVRENRSKVNLALSFICYLLRCDPNGLCFLASIQFALLAREPGDHKKPRRKGRQKRAGRWNKSEKWGRVSTFDNYCSSFFTWRGIRPFLPTLGTSQWSWHEHGPGKSLKSQSCPVFHMLFVEM
jgi:hypothetical protein